MSLLSLFYNTVSNTKARIAEIFYDIASKTLSTPNISVEPIDESTVGEVRLKELSSNGSNYVGFKSPDNLSGNLIFKLPETDGSNGQVLKIDGNKNLSFVDSAASAVHREEFDSSGQTTFTSAYSLTDKILIVMHNGIPKRPGGSYDYTVSGNDLIFTYTIPAGHWVTIIVLA